MQGALLTNDNECFGNFDWNGFHADRDILLRLGSISLEVVGEGCPAHHLPSRMAARRDPCAGVHEDAAALRGLAPQRKAGASERARARGGGGGGGGNTSG